MALKVNLCGQHLTIWYIRTSFILIHLLKYHGFHEDFIVVCCMQGLNFQYQFRRHGDEDANNFYL